MKKYMVSLLLVSLFAGSLSACVSFAETPGERFQKVMKEMADLCQSKKLIATDSRCILPKMQPAVPLATEEGRFAHSIKIPNPVPEDSGYKPGMTPEQYFDHLCKTEAGEFIYKTVENIEGLYVMRPRVEATDWELEHLYALEDPYGYTNAEATMSEYYFVSPNRYSYFERSSQPVISNQGSTHPSARSTSEQSSARYERFTGYDSQHLESMQMELVQSLKSQYGFTWRGISRPHDRELGIAGGELIVVDLETYAVLGVRRGFMRTGGFRNTLTNVSWLTGQTCPAYGYRKGRNKDFDFSYWFIGKILKSKNHEQSFKELTNAK